MINLNYSDGLDGERLKHNDALIKHRAQIRSNQLSRLGDTRSGYNIISGTPCAAKCDPEPPQVPAQLAHWMAHPMR
jgi:hypothetical protein